jgi:protein-tyrosine phosphatase
MSDPERRIAFEQVFNFRDLGGYRAADGRTVRWRRLFRSAEHHRMTAEEAARAREEFGIRTVVDFRAEGEAQHRLEPGPLVREGVTQHRFGMGDPKAKYRAREAGTWSPGFAGMLDGGAENWVKAVTVLAEENAYPALFHCVTGKDRTGVLAALILDVLGVDEETIVEDYGLSQLGMDDMVASMRARGVIGPDEERNPALGVVPEAMREMITVLRERYGTAGDFLVHHGAEPAALERLQALLLE